MSKFGKRVWMRSASVCSRVGSMYEFNSATATALTPDASIDAHSCEISSSVALLTVLPRPEILQLISNTLSRLTSTRCFAMRKSNADGSLIRPISRTSRIPIETINAIAAPFPCSSAFTPRVVPWTMRIGDRTSEG